MAARPTTDDEQLGAASRHGRRRHGRRVGRAVRRRSGGAASRCSGRWPAPPAPDGSRCARSSGATVPTVPGTVHPDVVELDDCTVIVDPTPDGRERLVVAVAQAGRERPAERAGRRCCPAVAGGDRARPRAAARHRATACPSSLVWELAYAEMVYVADRVGRSRGGPSGRGDRRISPPSSPLRRARLGGAVANPPLPRHRGGAAHLQARRGRPHRRAAHRAPRQGPRRRQGCAQDHVEVRRPARAAQPCAACCSYQGRELDIVSQAESVETLAPLVGDLDHLTNGLAIVEAVDQMTMDREPAPHVYRMLVGALRTVAERSGPLVVPAFYWKLLASEGVRPELDECVRCGATEPLVAFDVDRGWGAVPLVPHGRADLGGGARRDADDPRRPPERRARPAGRVRPPTRWPATPTVPSSTTSNAACAPSRCSRPTDHPAATPDRVGRDQQSS